MNITVPSFVAGPLLLAALFALCLVIVLGTKILFSALKVKLPFKRATVAPAPQERPMPAPVKQPTAPAVPKRKPRTVKSIVIDPDDVDRIYVRKSS